MKLMYESYLKYTPSTKQIWDYNVLLIGKSTFLSFQAS